MFADFYSSRFVQRTRRFHTCNWCGQKIIPHNKAFYFAGKWEGDFGSGYMHMECYHAFSFCNQQGDFQDDGYDPGSYGRGRTDDRKKELPEFDADGKKI
jgi:hypothetical protein